MKLLDTTNENVIMQYKSIIKAIVREINVKKISIPQFCDDREIDIAEFLTSLTEIREDFSYYLKILEALKDY